MGSSSKKKYKVTLFFGFFVGVFLFPNIIFAAISFRSKDYVAWANSTSITPSEPSGCAENDIEIFSLWIDTDNAVTAPSGWSSTFGGTTLMAEVNSTPYRQYGYWIRRGASAPSLTWSYTTSGAQGVIVCYQGATTSGNPFSFGTSAVRDNASAKTYPDVSGVTLNANEMLIWFGGAYELGSAGTPPTGFDERQDVYISSGSEGTEVADLLKASSGSTGTVSGASYTGGNNGATSVLFMGLIPDGGSGGGTTIQIKFRGGVKLRGGAKFR